MEVKHSEEGVPVSNWYKRFMWANSDPDAELLISDYNTFIVILWDELLL